MVIVALAIVAIVIEVTVTIVVSSRWWIIVEMDGNDGEQREGGGRVSGGSGSKKTGRTKVSQKFDRMYACLHVCVTCNVCVCVIGATIN